MHDALHCNMHGPVLQPTLVATCSFWSSGVLQAASSRRHPYPLAAHTVSWHHHPRHLQGKLHHLVALSLQLFVKPDAQPDSAFIAADSPAPQGKLMFSI